MRLKKTLAFALAIAMVFGVVSIAAAAPAVHGTAFADVAADHPKAKQILALGALGIALGDGGLGSNFNPDGTLTRAEFATFAVRLANLEDSAKALSNYSPTFNDVDAIPEWAYGYINVAQSEGIVVGDDQGNFNASQAVTYAEALTMLVRVTGWKDTVTGTNWPINYLTRAIGLGLSDGVSLQASSPITRGDMAALLYNAGDQRKPNLNADGKWDGTLAAAGTALFAQQSFTGILNYSPASGTVDIDAETGKALADDVYLSGFASIDAAVGRQVRAFMSGGKVVGIEATTAGTHVTGVYRDTIPGDGGATYIRLRNGELVRLPATVTNARVSVNGAAAYAWPGHDALDPASNPLNQIAANDTVTITTEKGVAVSITATRYQGVDLRLHRDPVAKKDNDVSSYNHVIFADQTGQKIRTDGALITLNGQPTSIDSLKKDDVVNLAIVAGGTRADAATAYRIDATRNAVQVKSHDDKVISFDGDYRVTFKVTLEDDSKREVKLADEYATYADANAVATPSKGVYLLNSSGEAAHFVPAAGPARPAHAKLVMGHATAPVFDVGGVMVVSAGAVTNATDGTNLNELGTATYTDGKVSAWSPLTGTWTGRTAGENHFEVVAVDKENNSITYKDTSASPNTFHIINNPTIYKGADFDTDNSVGAFLGLDGLKVGDMVKVQGNAVLVR